MLPFLTEQFGNPSSAHAFGRKARAGARRGPRADRARLNAEPREIVFTSGGTEANNLALKGAAWAGKARGHRIVTSPVEHHAVGHTLRYLEKFGFEIVELPVDRYGRVDPDQLDAAITDKTILVSIMLANNEVGTHPADRRDRAPRSRPTRASCSPSTPSRPRRTSTSTSRRSASTCSSIAAHKFEGPKGVGALYLRHGTHILAQQQGGDAGAPSAGRHGERRRAPSGWRPPTSWRAPSGPRRSSACAASASGSRRRSSRSTARS